MIIPKGCTVENTFSIPFEANEIATLYVTYSQNEEVVIEKELEDCVIENKELKVYLSQEDTLKFDSNIKIEIQVRLRLLSGEAKKSHIITTKTDRILKDEVI